MKLTLRKRSWLISAAALAFAIGCYIRSFYAPLVPIEISKETTWLTEPMTDDGYLFYARAHNQLAGAGVTSENNAAFDSSRDQFRIPEGYELRRELNEGEDFHRTAVYEIFQRLEFTDARKRPWSADDDPLGFDFLSLNRRMLDEVVLLSHRTRYFEPLAESRIENWSKELRGQVCDLWIPENYSGLRDFGDLLEARAMLQFGAGDVESGISDLAALCRYRDLIAQQPGSVLYFGRFSEEISALRAVITASLLIPEEAERFLAFAETRSNNRSLDECILDLDGCARLRILGTVQAYHTDAARGFPNRSWRISHEVRLDSLERQRFTRRVDWNAVMRKLNDVHDRWVAELTCERDGVHDTNHQPCRQIVRNAAFADVRAAASFTQTGDCTDAFFTLMLAGSTWPDDYLEICDVELTNRRLARLAPRLAHWNLRQGIYPTRLEELLTDDSLPPLQSSVLIDPFTGRQFSYQLRKGGFLLYGLGKDRMDNPWGRYGKLDDVVVCWPLP